jgi:hypothetical protein
MGFIDRRQGLPVFLEGYVRRAFQLLIESDPLSFDPEFKKGLHGETMRELMQNVALRDRIWGR